MELKLAGGRLRVNILLLPTCGLLIWIGGVGGFFSFAGALLLHECAHLFAASALGVRVVSMELLPFGCAAHLGSFEFISRGKEVLVAAAGPAANILAALACEALLRDGAEEFRRANLVLAAMNLLPSLPLDGGRIAAVLLNVFFSRRTALLTASILGVITGTGICVLGVLLGGTGCISFFVMGGFMLYSSIRGMRPAQLDAMALSAAKQRGLARRSVMDIHSVACSGTRSIGEVFLSLDQRKYNLVYIVDENMRVRGVTDEGMLMQRMLREGATAKIAKKESEHWMLRP